MGLNKREWGTLILIALGLILAMVAVLEFTRDGDVHGVYNDPYLGRR